MPGQDRGDFSRDTFDPANHFSQVFSQEGRVQIDADVNEQTKILLHYLRALGADVIGPAGGPASHLGFEISALKFTPPVTDDFRIGLGHYYVDGIRCEADATAVAVVVAANDKVRVEDWTLDGVELKAGQFLEIFDHPQPPATPAFTLSHAPAFALTPVRVTSVDTKQQVLTLEGAPTTLGSATGPRIRRAVTFKTQPDYPSSEDVKSDVLCVYLDVWERHITCVEDDRIREVALGGPDTGTRDRITWQVKVLRPGSALPIELPCVSVDQLRTWLQPDNRGRLKAMAKQDMPATDPCLVPPSAGYRGPENQLYRVEIHRAGRPSPAKTTAPNVGAKLFDDNVPISDASLPVATFKWSRENGSVVFPISSIKPKSVADTITDTITLTLESLGKDDRFGLHEGGWVEIQDDESVLLNQAGPLLRVQAIDRMDMTVTLKGVHDPKIGGDPTKHPLVRRWDHFEKDLTDSDPTEEGLQLAADGAALVIEGTDTWLSLEDGVQIQFQPAFQGLANYYRTGDYWLIPARTTTGDVEWPRHPVTHAPAAVGPHGVTHHYAPLAVIRRDANVITIHDCRSAFPALTQPIQFLPGPTVTTGGTVTTGATGTGGAAPVI